MPDARGLLSCPSRPLPWLGQRFEAGNHIEQLLVDAALAQTVEGPVEILQQFVDVLLSPLHRREAAGVLARQGLRTGPEQRDEEVFADQRPQGRAAAADDLGQVSRGPGKPGQPAAPVVVQRQQALADGRIDRVGCVAVVEKGLPT